jgi:ATP-binding cassette subfamily C protein CydC
LLVVGLSVLDVSLALMLGGIMLATLIILPPLFYRAGKPTGESLTQLRAIPPAINHLAAGSG